VKHELGEYESTPADTNYNFVAMLHIAELTKSLPVQLVTYNTQIVTHVSPDDKVASHVGMAQHISTPPVTQ
jgi:hypothetical protein